MIVVLQDGYTFEAADINAVHGGIVLFEREENEGANGFVPHHQLMYVLPDRIAEDRGHPVQPSDGPPQGGAAPQQSQTGESPYQQPYGQGINRANRGIRRLSDETENERSVQGARHRRRGSRRFTLDATPCPETVTVGRVHVRDEFEHTNQ